MILRLAVCSLLLVIVRSDPLHISIDIHCDPPRLPWCGDLFIYEADSEGTHDVLKFEHFCTEQTEQRFNWTFWPGGDLSPHYEIAYQLNHNCHTDGYVRCIKIEPVTVKHNGERKVKFIANIRDVGTQPGCPAIY